MIWTFLLLTSTVTGALFYRMRGGEPDLPRPVEQVLFCLIFIVAMDVFGVGIWAGLIPFIIAVLITCTGHGQYFLSLTPKLIKNERIDFLLRPIFGHDPRDLVYAVSPQEIDKLIDDYGREKLYWRCVTGMAMTGFLISLAPGIAVAFWHPLPGVLLALSGLIKAPAYMASHRIGQGTEGGEWGYGGAQWFIGAAIIIIFTGVTIGQ